MSRTIGLSTAKLTAESVLKEFGVSGLFVDPIAIAAKKNILVQAKPDTDAGVSGMLLRHGDEFGIMYATHVPSEGFQRFSVAHELGHFCLPGHIDHILPKGGVHVSQAGFVSGDRYELEADTFAASLLMPSDAFKRAIGRQDPGLAIIEKLATECRTSLTATAIRYAELTTDAVAVIISAGQSIDFCFLSDAMKSLPDLTWLKKGSSIPKRTETARFNADAERIARGDREESKLDVMDWLGGKRSAIVTEEVVGLGKYGKTLTVLSSTTIGQEEYVDQDDDDRALEKSWTPRFSYKR